MDAELTVSNHQTLKKIWVVQLKKVLTWTTI